MWPLKATASACSRLAIKSSGCSIPMDRRMVEPRTPNYRREVCSWPLQLFLCRAVKIEQFIPRTSFTRIISLRLQLKGRSFTVLCFESDIPPERLRYESMC